MKKKMIIFIPICILLVVITIILYKQIKSDELKGLWSIDNYTKYEFDGKGKGKLIVPLNNYKFTYKIKNNIVSIDFENETSIDVNYEYKINKDELEIINQKEHI